MKVMPANLCIGLLHACIMPRRDALEQGFVLLLRGNAFLTVHQANFCFLFSSSSSHFHFADCRVLVRLALLQELQLACKLEPFALNGCLGLAKLHGLRAVHAQLLCHGLERKKNKNT